MSGDFTLSTLTSILGALSIGALITAAFQFWTDRAKLKGQKRVELKEVRFKAIILLMDALLDFDKATKGLKEHGRNFINKEELHYELQSEWRNMLLYANDDVIINMKRFLKEPTEDHFYKTSIAMRKSLYGLKTRLSADDLV